MSFNRRVVQLSQVAKESLSGAKSIFEVFYSCSTNPPPGAFPLWTGEWLRNCATLYPDFYNKAIEYRSSGNIRVIDNTFYEYEVSTYGQCGAFVINGNDIRLPKIVNWISGFTGMSNVGRALPAGLPNIWGEFKTEVLPDGKTGGAYYTGAFYGGTSLSHKHISSNAFDPGNRAIAFSANRCSSVYGSSYTVQPPSIQLALYIQVYNQAPIQGYVDTEAAIKTISDYYDTMDKKISNAIDELTKLVNSNTSMVGFPDYKNRQTRTVNAEYTESGNGWLMVLLTAYGMGASGTLTINGVSFTQAASSGGKHYEDYNTTMVPLPAGSVWKYTYNNYMGYTPATIYWIPCL